MPDDTATIPAVTETGVDQPDNGSQTSDVNQAAGTETSTVDDGISAGTEESFTTVDPNTLPPELQTIYKSMQGDFTRKTQEIASARKDMEALRIKADGYDALLNSGLIDRKPADPAPAADKAPSALDLSQMSGEDLLVKLVENPKLLQDIVENTVQQRVGPLETQYYDRLAQEELTTLRGKYADFEQHEPEIASYIERFNMGPEEAYKLVTYDKVRQSGVDAGVAAAAKRAATAQPNSNNVPVATPGGAKNIADSFRAAMKAAGIEG